MEPIEFCIVVPAYNCEKYIKNCVKSVCNGTYPHFHMLLVDDGSTDGTPALCDRLAEADQRITVLHQKNAGALAARVAGIQYFQRNAQPDAFLYCLDSDDALTPNALEVLAAAIQKEGCDLVFLRAWWVYPGGKERNLDPIGMPNSTISDKRQLYKLFFGNTGYNPLWRKAVKLSLFTADDFSKYYGLRLSEDLLQSIPLYKNCQRVTFLPDILYRYTVNPTSVVNTVRYDNFKSNNTVFQVVWDFLQSENLWTQQDYLEYLAFCCVQVRETLWIVLRFHTCRKNIFETLNTMRKEPAYIQILNTVTLRDFDLWLLKQGCLLPLWMIGRGYRFAGIVYHRLKGDKS